MNPTEELHVVPSAPSRPARQRRPVWLLAVAMFAAAILGFMLNELRGNVSFEQKRAERATAAAVQACDQVKDLGYACKADLSKLDLPAGERGRQGDKGDQGTPGKQGPPPTMAQIQTAVRTWLAAHPPPAGATGATGPAGAPCPDGYHWAKVRVLVKSHWTDSIMCIKD